jgi:DNA repair protein RecO (recombination protein O)
MNFKDLGIIIAKRPLKESLQLLTVFTQNHGLYSGIIRESSKKNGSIYSEGNLVDFFWQARLHEHVGTAKCELIKAYGSTIIIDKTRLYAFNSIICLIKSAFHDREPHNNFFPEFVDYLNKSIQKFSIKDYVKLELSILNEAGYGLQLESCAATGSTNDLYYVSPKSGIAVSRDAGLPYADKLLMLPSFLTKDDEATQLLQVKQAFDLTTYFFNRYFFTNHQQPEPRSIFTNFILSNFKV